MKIPEQFRNIIANTFYDKEIEIYTTAVIKDNEGAVIGNGKKEKIDTFKGNFQLSTREYIQKEYGIDIEANAIITCDNTIGEIGNIAVYKNKDYEIKNKVISDSHTTLLVLGD